MKVIDHAIREGRMPHTPGRVSTEKPLVCVSADLHAQRRDRFASAFPLILNISVKPGQNKLDKPENSHMSRACHATENNRQAEAVGA